MDALGYGVAVVVMGAGGCAAAAPTSPMRRRDAESGVYVVPVTALEP